MMIRQSWVLWLSYQDQMDLGYLVFRECLQWLRLFKGILGGFLEHWHPINVLLRDSLPPLSATISNTSDVLLWRNTISRQPGQFNSALTWSTLHSLTDIVCWKDAVWFSNSIPKDSFIFWLIMKDRLPTRDRLFSWGLQVPFICRLCAAEPESTSHIYFKRAFSSQVYNQLFIHHNFNPSENLVDSVSWVIRSSTSRKVKTICLFTLQAIIYELWRERNSRIHSNSTRPYQTVTKEIQIILKKKLYGLDRLGRGVQVPSTESSYLSSWFGFFQF